MKKLLAMVLALVMTLSLAVSTNAAFKDAKDVDETFTEAVEVLNGMKVFKGYEDGSFQPKGDITRAEVAAIVYRVYTKDVADTYVKNYETYNKFSDMAGAGWAKGYIGYCANAALVKGYPNGTFAPSGKVTGYEVLAMILRAVGYDQNNEFTGADWALHVAQIAEQNGILDNVKGVDLNKAATRELVAELLFQSIQVPMVTYTAAFGYQTVSLGGDKLIKDNVSLGSKNFGLSYKYDDGAYGRPIKVWFDKDHTSTKYATLSIAPDASYKEAVTECDLCKDLSVKKTAKASQIWVDGVKTLKADETVTYTATNSKDTLGAQGQLTEVYAESDGSYRIVHINTYLAKVTKVIEEVKDKNDHIRVEASVNVDVYGTKTDKSGDVTLEIVKDSFETDGFKKGDMVLVTYDDGDIASMELAEGKVAKLTSVKGNKHVGDSIADIQTILGVAYADATVACKATYNPMGTHAVLGSTYTFYYDTYGNIIGVDEYTADADYAVIDKIWYDHQDGKVVVYANLVLASDASLVEKVVIDSIDDDNLDLDDVDANAKYNDEFYHDLYAFSVNKDGEYELYQTGIKVEENRSSLLCNYDAESKKDVIYTGSYTKGNVYLDNDTVILFQYNDSPDGKFKSYTLETLPENFWGYVEYVVGSDGKADIAYIRGVETATSYVFIPNVNNVTTKVNEDKTVTLTLKNAMVLKDDGTFETKDLKVTGKSENIVVDDINAYLIGSKKLTGLKAAGLYELYTFGENDCILEYTGIQQVTEVKEFSGKTVLGVYEDSDLVEIDDSKVTYTYWTGDYAGQYNVTGNDNPYAASVKQETNPNVTGLEAGDWVYVQTDAKGNVVAVYEFDFEVAVEFANANVDKDATIKAPTMYFGKEAKDFTVSVSKWVAIDSVNNDYTATSSKEHSEARTYDVKAQAKDTVDGDIVVTLKADPAHKEAWLELNKDVESQNLQVTLNQTDNQVVVTTDNGTIKVNDVAKFLKAAGTHVQGYQFYNNTEANPVASDSTDDIEIANLFILVTAEDGSTVKYTFTAPAAV